MNNEILNKDTSIAILKAFGCKEISTPQQKANGTDVWELPRHTIIKYNDQARPGWKPRFAIYKSGYIRVLYGHYTKNMYQINPTYEQTYYIDSMFNVRNYTIKKRALIYGDAARYQYLIQYIFKNYKKYLEI
jgi:hypothetical protein